MKKIFSSLFTVLIVLFFVILAIASTDDSSSSSSSSTPPLPPTSNQESTPSPTPTPELTPTNVLIVDYVEMFHNFEEELYLNRWVQITGVVTIRTFMLPIYFGEGLDGGWVSATDEEDTLKDNFNTGDYVTVIGYVESPPILTRTVHLKHATARFATQDEIEGIDVFSGLRDDAAAHSEQEYKDNAITVSYDNLVRNPHDYMGMVLKVTGSVQQIMGEGSWLFKSGYRFYEGSSSSKEWFIYYDLPEGSSRILEGDRMTFYGEYNGVEKFSRSIGGDVYIPTLKAVYVG